MRAKKNRKPKEKSWRKNIDIFSFFWPFLFLSRLLFLTPQAAFFDSPEYITRLQNPSYLDAVSSGHLPFHSGYLVLFYPLYHLASILHLPALFCVLLGQTILVTLAMYAFYRALLLLFDPAQAKCIIVITALLPAFWIANESIMMETTYLSSLLFSFFFLIFYLRRKTSSHFLLCSAFFYGFAVLTHLLILLWFPLFFFFCFLYKKEKISFFTATFLISIFLFSSLNALFIMQNIHLSFFSSLFLLFVSKSGEHVQIEPGLHGVLVLLRNALLPLLRNNTTLICILGFAGLLLVFRQSKKMWFLLLLWILPAFIANQWWDSLLFGRHALFASFGLAILAAFPLRKMIFQILIIVYLLLVSLPALFLLKLPIPYLEEAQAIEKLPKGLLVESHFARPQVTGHYQGKIVFVNEPGWNEYILTKQIKDAVSHHIPVFITASALSDPYGLYSGPYVHILSLSYANAFALKNVISQVTVKPYVIINQADNLVIYRVTSPNPSSYPNVPKLTQSRRRIDYFDPFTRVFFFFKDSK